MSTITRGELHKEMGDQITITCNSCATVNRKYINRISADVDNRIILAGISAGIIISALSVFHFSFIATLLLCIPIIVCIIEMSKSHAFKSYRIRRS
ncbi:hypothetical protein [Nonlabens spongiae]|uniref:hypothetical protein n=1 Tax=Nonlabens spongiae TaxID=331648 RepID=UPI0012F4F367|nr:hypothetical protein [Nonlabens spongiae]